MRKPTSYVESVRLMAVHPARPPATYTPILAPMEPRDAYSIYYQVMEYMALERIATEKPLSLGMTSMEVLKALIDDMAAAADITGLKTGQGHWADETIRGPFLLDYVHNLTVGDRILPSAITTWAEHQGISDDMLKAAINRGISTFLHSIEAKSVKTHGAGSRFPQFMGVMRANGAGLRLPTPLEHDVAGKKVYAVDLLIEDIQVTVDEVDAVTGEDALDYDLDYVYVGAALALQDVHEFITEWNYTATAATPVQAPPDRAGLITSDLRDLRFVLEHTSTKEIEADGMRTFNARTFVFVEAETPEEAMALAKSLPVRTTARLLEVTQNSSDLAPPDMDSAGGRPTRTVEGPAL